MNNESSQASRQQTPEPAEHVERSETVSPVDASEDRQASPAPPADDAAVPAEGAESPAVAQTPPGDATPGAEVSSDTSPAPQRPRAKIHIGSRRDRSDTPGPSKPEVAGTDKPINLEATPPPATRPPATPPPATPVPAPSVRDPLTPDLEQQFAAAMGGASLDEILGGEAAAVVPAAIELESHHRSVVARMHGDNVFFSLGGRNEGVASLRQFSEPPELGTELEVVVKSYSADDGLYELVIPGASARVEDWSDLIEGTVVEARITGANTGGLECKVGEIRGFIPSSQIAIFRVEDYAEYLDQKLLCVVAEVDPQRKNLVLSRRAVLEREKEEARKGLLESLQVGQVVERRGQKVARLRSVRGHWWNRRSGSRQPNELGSRESSQRSASGRTESPSQDRES